MNRWILRVRMPVFFLLMAVLCELKWPGIFSVGFLSVVILPLSARQDRKEEEERKCLEESTFYMEQMIYSFRKHRKIPVALSDVSALTKGRMNCCITRARNCLEQNGGNINENLFYQALSYVEAEYGYHLLHLLHTFLIRVEEQGGECMAALDLLLMQLRSWKKNQKEFISRRKKIQNRLILSVILSCVICMCVVRMMPISGSVTKLYVYQICTGMGLILFQVLYIIFRDLSVRAVLEETELSEKKKKNRKARHMEKLFEELKSPVHGIRWWNTVKKLEKQIRLDFPEWMFDMILRLQTENVHTAISHSLDEAPEVLVRPLYILIEEIEKDPVSIQPFLDFLSEFDLPEIHAVMLQLYAINDMGKKEIQEQIYAMLDQNQSMTEVTEELKRESVLSWMGLLAALPMMISVVVMVVNLSLMLFSFLGEMYRV